MSLESALEEERLGVMKILEEQKQKKRGKHQRNHSSSHHQPDEKDTSGATARSRSQPATRKQRPVSLLLNDEPLDQDMLADKNKEKHRSKSIGSNGSPTSSSGRENRRISYEDPTDPLTSADSYYYTSEMLRPRLRSPSPASGGAGTSTGARRPPMERSISSNSELEHTRSSSPYGSRSKSVDEYAKPFQTAYRRLSNNKLSKAEGPLGDLYRSGGDKRLQKDYDDGGSASDSSDEDRAREEDDDDDDYDNNDEAIASDDDEEEDEDEYKKRAIAAVKNSLIVDEASSIPKSESPSNVQRLKYKSLLDIDLPPGSAPPPSMAEYAAYKRRIIHPNTAFDTDIPTTDTPYTADTEEIMDARKAAQMAMQISPVHSNIQGKRVIRTMCRGDLPMLSDPNTPKQKSFIVSTDLSPEATHALEWTIGTVIRDGNVLYVVCAYEDDGALGADQQEEERLNAIDQMTSSVSKLLKKTRLQIHVVLEVIHCKSPKHMLTEIIDHVTPTMVILGSRGRSALKGVLLGSFSNYIVEKSSVPVMVARRKLQKTKNKGLNVRLANNLRAGARAGLSTAKVD